jgi:hypothetical protein
MIGWVVFGLLLLQLAEALRTGKPTYARFRSQDRLGCTPTTPTTPPTPSATETIPTPTTPTPTSVSLATVQRDDNAIEKLALFGLTAALAGLSKSPLKALKVARPSYASFVEVSRTHFMAGRSPLELKTILTTLLDRVIPPFVKVHIY